MVITMGYGGLGGLGCGLVIAIWGMRFGNWDTEVDSAGRYHGFGVFVISTSMRQMVEV